MIGAYYLGYAYYGMSGGKTSIPLVISDSTHSHTADSIVILQEHSISVADTLHGHTVDALIIAQEHYLGIADALHGHTADSIDLTQGFFLVVDDALHSHTVDTLDLVQSYFVTIADSTHGITSTTPTLSQEHHLTISDALHAQLVENTIILFEGLLQIQDAIHGHTADISTVSVLVREKPESPAYIVTIPVASIKNKDNPLKISSIRPVSDIEVENIIVSAQQSGPTAAVISDKISGSVSGNSPSLRVELPTRSLEVIAPSDLSIAVDNDKPVIKR